ncbi:MAG: maleylpyruvate isomerase family mycothiol-dependent enzyme [Terrimesophilobacter sp.]
MESLVLDDLVAEQAVLDGLVQSLDEPQWMTPTPAAGWSVRDQIAHLAMFDDVATTSLTGGGEVRFAEIIAAVAAGNTAFIDSPAGGRPGSEVLSAWRQARDGELAAFRRIDPTTRVPWGPNLMSAMSLCTARLMETWAHGLDCFAALGVEPVDTDRLRHVCHITYQAIPYALMQSGVPEPGTIDDLVVEVASPGGTLWRFGRSDAPNRIDGTAAEFARVGVRRMPLAESSLRAYGPLAEMALPKLKAYL